MKWTKKAEEALSRVPFFVRKRVKKRVEQEAANCGAKEVTIDHVLICQKRFLNQMEDEVKGFHVESCFGPTGCPNRAVHSDGLPQILESGLKERDLKGFLKGKVKGPLKMHHGFRVSISDCPNACSRPQIVDVGLIGACRPEVSEESCSQCGGCVEICKENAISLRREGPRVDYSRCLSCGQCLEGCPTGTLGEGFRGYRIQVGGKLGRHPQLGTELPGIYELQDALAVVNRCLDHYMQHCVKGERFGEILEKTGMKDLISETNIENRERRETMFCYQCEQTAKGEGCTKVGVCGKQPEVAALQDLLIYAMKGLSLYAVEGRKVGVNDKDINVFTCESIFSTLTNVDFDPERFVPMINRCVELRESLKEKVSQAGGKVDFPEGPATFKPDTTLDGLVKQGESVGVKPDLHMDPDIHSLQQTLVYGIKGVAAYADHAHILGQEDDKVYAFIHEGLAATLNKDLTLDDYVGLVLKCGEINLRAMELLDAGNTGTYGHPIPTSVPLGVKKGKAILVSGHDLKDLDEVLKQSEGKGINVYTHGEMLPCHGYPELKKYPHFYGHYGTAWQNQKKEFDDFPGAILMTTNCIQNPRDSYKENIFTTGLVGWPGVTHIADKDFSAVIEKALAMPGFPEDSNGRSVMAGFGRNAVMGVADKVIEAVKGGAIKHFFLVAGCDGAKPGRNYYTQFVEQVPDDCVVLTLACGKFRFFDKDLGDIGGIPRLLDIGQCNDAYSAIQIAIALSQAFDVGVNELPLSMILSWYEQKAVAILLTLLHLGIKNIRLGPSLPAFITPNVLDVLIKNFNIMPISTPEQDLKAILG